MQGQSDCSKPERFDELTSAWFIDTIDVLLAEVKNTAPIDSKSKLERTSLLRFVSLFKFCLFKTQVYELFFCAANAAYFYSYVSLCFLSAQEAYEMFDIKSFYQLYSAKQGCPFSLAFSS